MQQRTRQRSLRIILIGAFAAQLLSIAPLWSHTSTPANLFGQYSTRYALALAVNAGAIVIYALALMFTSRLSSLLRRVPTTVLMVFAAVIVIGAMGVCALSLEMHVLAYFGLTALTAVAVLLYPLANGPDTGWRAVIWGTVIVLIVPLFLSALAVNVFEPDEAHYLDFANTFLAGGGLRAEAWLDPDWWTVRPGFPLQLAAYGWLVDQIGYTVYVGRVLSFGWALLCAGGLYVAGRQLYNKDVGLLAAGAGLLSLSFVPEWEYRPSKSIIVVSAWALALYLWGRSQAGARRYTIFALLGLCVTLSLNIHASGIVVAAAYSLWFAFMWIWALVRRTPDARTRFYDVLAFAGGALVGTILYILTNVMPVGGIGPYLGAIGERRENSPLLYPYQRWDSLLERVLVLFGVMWLAWRRRPGDRTLLSVLGFTILAGVFIDREGYIWHFGPLYFLVIAVLLTQAAGRGLYRAALISATVLIMGALSAGTFVDWGVVRQFTTTGTLPPYLYNELKSVLPQYVTPEDRIYSTHQLLWIFPRTERAPAPTVTSYGAELGGMERWGLDDKAEVWEVVDPTVIIFVEGHMNYDPGMQAYMEENPYELCDEFTVQAHTIRILRPDCAAGPPI